MRNDRWTKKRMILAICMVIGALLVALGTTAAIYTSQVFRRSVVRNRFNETVRFSSDKLYRVAELTGTPQTYYYPMGQNEKTMTFKVCNYDQGDNIKFNDQTIDYEITFTLIDGTENVSYRISNGSNTKTLTSGSVSFDSEQLLGGAESTNRYHVTFVVPNGSETIHEDYFGARIKVTVVPKEDSLAATQGSRLEGILLPIKYASTKGVTMRYEYIDNSRGTASVFEAYNLMVSVSGGEGNVKITWDHTKLDIDPFFVEKLEALYPDKDLVETDPEHENKTVLTVPMNANDNTGTYLIQFYNHESIKPEDVTWETLPIEVELVSE